MSPIRKFNIRVYGLLYNNLNQLLLSTENLNGYIFTKFPGGGLEFGEGTHDCIIREFREECMIDVQVDHHIYTTDFFQQSAFSKEDQVISIYYKLSSEYTNSIRLDEHLLHDSKHSNHTIRFFWVDETQLNQDMLTFPIDKYLVENIL